MKRVVVACFALIFAGALPFVSSAQPVAAPELLSALQHLRSVNSSFIIGWSADPRPPQSALGSVNGLEKQIVALDSSDREALLFWLQSHGRDALHQRGATDAEIGAPLYPIDYKIKWVPLPEGFVNPTPIPTATPEPPPTPKPTQAPRSRGMWGFIVPVVMTAIATIPAQSATIASSSHTSTVVQGNSVVTTTTSSSVSAGVDVRGVANMLANEATKEHPSNDHGSANDPNVPNSPGSSGARQWTNLELGRQRSDTQTSGIAVDSGVAGVRGYSESAACVGFTNRNEKSVREVDFDFTLVDAHDRSLQSIALHRAGTFAPNEASEAPRDATAAGVARDHANCVTIGSSESGAPVVPSVSRAVAMAYEIRRVVFDDGTIWMRPGANLWPHEESSTMKQSTEP